MIATNKAKTLITGGAGFIGSHLVDPLMTQVTNVHVFDNLSSGKLQKSNAGSTTPISSLPTPTYQTKATYHCDSKL